MPAKANYFKLGLFILAAIAITVAMVLALGAGKLFQRTVTLETYIDDSVQGLDIGSKVRYRGVLLGEVKRLGFTAEQYELDKPLGQRKPYVLVEAVLKLSRLGPLANADVDLMKQYIDHGLRIRVAPQGITGVNYLELDFVDPLTNPPLPIDWQPQNPYIPSARAKLVQFTNQIETVLRALEEVNFKKLARDINSLVLTATHKLDKLPVEKIGTEASTLLSELRETNRKLAELVGGEETKAAIAEIRAAGARLRQVLANPALETLPDDVVSAANRVRALADSERLHRAIANLDSTLARLDQALAGSEHDIAATLVNLRQTSENLRELTEAARRYPAGTLFGAPPPPIRRDQ